LRITFARIAFMNDWVSISLNAAVSVTELKRRNYPEVANRQNPWRQFTSDSAPGSAIIAFLFFAQRQCIVYT
jgi:hypothetical protein